MSQQSAATQIAAVLGFGIGGYDEYSDDAQALASLVADIRHFCDRSRIDFGQVVFQSYVAYKEDLVAWKEEA